MAHHGRTQDPQQHHPALPALESTRAEPGRNLWQFLRQAYLSNRDFDTYEEILDAACEAWNRLIDQPWRIMSIGLHDWAHNGHSL